jgi:transformation/transcription domain-associated protein
MQLMKKAAAARAANMNQATVGSSDQTMRDGTQTINEPNMQQPLSTAKPDANFPERPPATGVAPVVSHVPSVEAPLQRQPWEYVDEVLQVLKTSFPLLILSLETMVDQIQHKFKLTPDEEIYRNVCMLLQDAIQVGSLSFCGATVTSKQASI